MSLLSRFFDRCFRGSGGMTSKQVCIVDANGFIDKRYREANGQPSPRDNFHVLKNLAYFAHREEIEMTAVFIGRPLREAGDGDSFKSVTVYYADDEKALSQKIRGLARAGRSNKEVIVITDNRQTEEDAINLGAQCMRLATFKKGMEGSFDHDRQPRPIQRRAPAEAEQPSDEDSGYVSEEKPGKNVLDLIDPI